MNSTAMTELPRPVSGPGRGVLRRLRAALCRPLLLRDQRGTASIEAAVMLPVMALCWAGLMLRFDHIERLMDAGVSARRDAWLFSAGGCEDIPDGSTSVLVSHCLGDGAGWMATLQKIPLLGSLIGTITGYEAEASAHRDFKSPPLLGGKSQQSKYTYHLACNEKSREGDYILRSVLCQQIKNLGLGFAVGDCPGAPAHASCD